MNQKLLNYEEFILAVIEAMQEAGVIYMVGGAVAAWAWGEPRATMDLDVVVDIPFTAIDRFSKELEKRDMLVPSEIILENILDTRADTPINAIHSFSGFKADLYPLRVGDALRSQALERRRMVDLGMPLGEIFLHSPEDLIIYKLWYFSLSQQTKHIRDITSIVLSRGGSLDYAYIDRWTEKKGLTQLWKSLLAKIQAK